MRTTPDSRPAGAAVAPAGRAEPVVTAAAYLMLILLGAGEGLAGCFFYAAGPAPLAALAFAAGILLTCLFGGFGMGSPAGALAAAAGWFVTVFVLTTATGGGGGSVLVTATTPGTFFLFGGAAAAIAGTVGAFTALHRAARARR